MLSERYETTSGEESGEVVEEERSALIGEVWKNKSVASSQFNSLGLNNYGTTIYHGRMVCRFTDCSPL